MDSFIYLIWLLLTKEIKPKYLVDKVKNFAEIAVATCQVQPKAVCRTRNEIQCIFMQNKKANYNYMREKINPSKNDHYGTIGCKLNCILMQRPANPPSPMYNFFWIGHLNFVCPTFDLHVKTLRILHILLNIEGKSQIFRNNLEDLTLRRPLQYSNIGWIKRCEQPADWW